MAELKRKLQCCAAAESAIRNKARELVLVRHALECHELVRTLFGEELARSRRHSGKHLERAGGLWHRGL